MSYKSSTNGIKVNMEQWKTASLMDTSVKFAGEEAKDRLYEPKHKKKLVRVLTVVAYVFFVSLAAIMLSLYYVFLWKGDQKLVTKYVTSSPPRLQRFYMGNCNSILAEMQQQLIAAEVEPIEEQLVPTTTSIPDDIVPPIEEYDIDSSEELRRTSPLIEKIMAKEGFPEQDKFYKIN